MKLRDDLHALAGAYALDALVGQERERFEHHLTRCTACSHELRGLQETATRFALAVSSQPPAQLKSRVLAAVARTRQLPPLAGTRPLPEPRVAWTRRLTTPLLAAFAVAVIVLAVLLGMARNQLGAAEAKQREIAAVLTTPGARMLTDRTSLGGEATVVVAGTLHKLIFTSSGLPALMDAKVYQLWVLGPGGSARSVGLLPAPTSGRTTALVATGLVPGDKVGISVEPAGGSTKPTTTPIVVIPLPS
jgi:anti-sigma-K factor RskA